MKGLIESESDDLDGPNLLVAVIDNALQSVEEKLWRVVDIGACAPGREDDLNVYC